MDQLGHQLELDLAALSLSWLAVRTGAGRQAAARTEVQIEECLNACSERSADRS